MKTIKNNKITILYKLKRLCESSPVHLGSFSKYAAFLSMELDINEEIRTCK